MVIISDIRLTSALSDTEVQYPIKPLSGDDDNLGFLTVRITALGRSVNTNSGHEQWILMWILMWAPMRALVWTLV